MIITKEARISAEQLKTLESIVGKFNCRILVISGTHRDIYAIIGDERSSTMINRISGLEFVERVDRIESVYKLMDIKSDLSKHQLQLGTVEVKEEPIFIAGHCTIDPENPSAFLETAEAVKKAGAKAIRGGVWKPRTSPHTFQGTIRSLDILLKAKEETGLPVVAEVMDVMQMKAAIDAGVDVLQVGARNALNYPLLRELGEATKGSKTAILLKRSIHMGAVDEFISAGEYVVAAGNPNLMLCPRGTQPTMNGYRNHPDESITQLLKGKTWAPVVVDPSHSVGHADYVPSCSMAAMAYGADGLIIESHCNPQIGIGDDPKQAITPDVLAQVIRDCKKIWEIRRAYQA